MSSPLENLARPGGQLTAEPPDERELSGLIAAGRRSLNDAGNADLALESRFLLAYNAAHALSLAALRRQGYRPRNRYIVFQVLPHTLGLGPDVWRLLAKAHEARNLAEYEGQAEVSEDLVNSVIAATRTIAESLKVVHP